MNPHEQTIQHYESNHRSFWEGTKDHDVNQNYAALQTRLPGIDGIRILDFGCGPGRDLKHFSQRGYTATGLDGCETFCEMAREHSGCEVLQQNFLKLSLPMSEFHGIFANASLFHIPKSILSENLKKMHRALKKEGILFCSNPRGDGEYFDGSRYGNYMEFEEYQSFFEEAGFEIIDHYYRPFGFPREEQPWLAIVAKKL
ncbi:MAG: class I SAM-dependent methyltransferase [Lentisphaeraceae bacterium]|nr:class I SAM-dependent methyltransferase [Lentisphaeraceae bacterium]